MSEAEYCTDEGQVLADMAYAEQNPDWDLNEPAEKKNRAAASDLIEVVQLPVIVERLHSLKAQIENATRQAMGLACSPETLQVVKEARADLNRQFTELEADRKSVKAKIMGPYEQFEAVYKDCVSGPFKAADADLKNKISIVEMGIIGSCLEKMQAYFLELIQAQNVEWLVWDQLNIHIGLADAKQKTHKKIRDKIFAAVSGVADSVQAISEMPNAEEIMVEYQKSLDLPTSVQIVADRHRRIEAQRQERAAWEARQAAEQETVAKVDAVIPSPAPVLVQAPQPVQAAAPEEDQEKTYAAKFTVHGTKSQLRKLKEFMLKEGIRYE